MRKMKVLITGAGGQLGRELVRTAPPSWTVNAVGRRDLDICREEGVNNILSGFSPHIIINAAAYTAVDQAEVETGRAYEVNARGAEILAREAGKVGARFIHLSTDFVFDGQKSRPYEPDDPTNPLGIYGKSKLEGERRVRHLTGGEGLIVRTSWLYSMFGHNFVKTILRLIQEKEKLQVVTDQVGSPTWAHGLAEALWGFAQRPNLRGTFHWADAGVASWYDFAVAIQEEGVALGLVSTPIPIYPIGSRDYPLKAPRPAYSVLDSSKAWKVLKITPRHWRESLRSCLRELARPPLAE